MARIPFSAHCECVLCGVRVRNFLPLLGAHEALVPPLQRDFDVIGSDPENFECPFCACHDRERHAFLYLSALNLMDAWPRQRILHFAPERVLRRIISNRKPSKYVCADLTPSEQGVLAIDIESIPFPDGSFDFVIANHVLEHVSDFRAALSEIYRCLSPGGLALLQVPFAAQLRDTFELAEIRSAEARFQAYGQEDHLRMFGNNVVDVFCSVGFISRCKQHFELLPEYDPAVYGVNVREPLMLFQRPRDS